MCLCLKQHTLHGESCALSRTFCSGVNKLFVSTNPTDTFCVFVDDFRANISVQERYIFLAHTNFKFTFICCLIPYDYVLLVLTCDAVFAQKRRRYNVYLIKVVS